MMTGKLTRETLQQRLEDAVSSLLTMARDSSWNKIVDNCVYIVTEIDLDDLQFSDLKNRKLKNDKKQPTTLLKVMPLLLDLYHDIYEINLFIYKSLKHETVIEIKYHLKWLMEPDYRKTIEENAPTLHSKVAIPFYAALKKERFDINWQLGTFPHRWKVFWARLVFKFNYRKQLRAMSNSK